MAPLVLGKGHAKDGTDGEVDGSRLEDRPLRYWQALNQDEALSVDDLLPDGGEELGDLRGKREGVLRSDKRCVRSQATISGEAETATDSVDLRQSLSTRFKLVKCLLKLSNQLRSPLALPQVRSGSEVLSCPYGGSGDFLGEVFVWLNQFRHRFQLSGGEFFEGDRHTEIDDARLFVGGSEVVFAGTRSIGIIVDEALYVVWHRLELVPAETMIGLRFRTIMRICLRPFVSSLFQCCRYPMCVERDDCRSQGYRCS
jgi:hypothetical protein